MVASMKKRTMFSFTSDVFSKTDDGLIHVYFVVVLLTPQNLYVMRKDLLKQEQLHTLVFP